MEHMVDQIVDKAWTKPLTKPGQIVDKSWINRGQIAGQIVEKTRGRNR